MKPDCFGNFTPMIPSACAQCAQRGPCASTTETADGFQFSPVPRYFAVQSQEVQLPTTDTAKLVAAVLAGCQAHFSVLAPWVQIGARKRLVRVMALNGPVGVVFKMAAPVHISRLPSAPRFEIRPLIEAAPKTAKTLTEVRRHLHLGGRGSIALTLRAADAVALIREAAVHIYGDMRDH